MEEVSGPPDDLAFASVKLDTREPVDCSPEVPRDEEGLRIAAPRRVLFAGVARVPLCATARFKSERKGLPHFLWDSTSLVVVAADGSELRVGPMAEPGGTPAQLEPDEPDPPPGPDDLVAAGGSVAKWANVDLVRQSGWAPRPGVIYAFIQLAGWQSNTVRVEFVAEEG